MTKLLFMAGSARKQSFNKRLAKTAADLAKGKGATVEFIDLADYDMPIFNEDIESESGLPDAAKALKKKFQDCDGFFIACPEYNSSISPLLKNTIDWMTRPQEENEAPLSAFKGKVAALASTSPGGLGGLRGLTIVRMLLGNIGVHVIPTQLAVGGAFDVFDDNGLVDEAKLKMLDAEIEEFVTTAHSLNA